MLCDPNLLLIISPVDLSNLKSIERVFSIANLGSEELNSKIIALNVDIGRINSKYANFMSDSNHPTVAGCLHIISQEGTLL